MGRDVRCSDTGATWTRRVWIELFGHSNDLGYIGQFAESASDRGSCFAYVTAEFAPNDSAIHWVTAIGRKPQAVKTF